MTKDAQSTPKHTKAAETKPEKIEEEVGPEKETKTSKKGKNDKKKGWNLIGKGTNTVSTLILCYGIFAANSFRSICYPTFPEIDPHTHAFLDKFANVIKEGDTLHAKIWVAQDAFPRSAPLAEFDFFYDHDKFVPFSTNVNASISKAQLLKGHSVLLSAEVFHKGSGQVARAKGSLVKKMKVPELRPKYMMLTGNMCPEPEEPSFGKKKTHIGRGLPQMQVRLVLDNTLYPRPWANGPYVPRLFVDEFWMTDDQLIKLNNTGTSEFGSEVHFGLMSAARWRFQQHMERSFSQNAKLLGEGSEEMLQMRDLVANTNPTLLIATFVVSILHLLFEFLAFKNDVIFWQGCDPEMLNKFVSVQSIVVGIFMQLLLLLYLWDESANILVLVTNVVAIIIDVWKVGRAMKLSWFKLFGFLPVPTLVTKVHREKADDFDGYAMRMLAMGLSPFIIAYGFYTTIYECHRGWYSLFLSFTASCVYSLGFVLMTPQVFINYKHKTVAFLPWRKFIYRAINTFIDDLFAFIIKMPTMHRLSCFRDDIIFIVYLVQRWQYPVDKSRSFDEDGYELDAPAEAVAEGAEDTKKDK